MECAEITSASNPIVKEAVRIRDRKRTGGANLFVLEGRKVIEAALFAGAEIRNVFFTDHFRAKVEGLEFLRLFEGSTARLIKVGAHVFAKISDTETPQGVAAVASYPLCTIDTLPPGNALYTVVDGVQDPGNLGTIIRTADAAGASSVILLEGTCDVFMPKVIRATAGSIFNLPVARAKTEFLLEWRRKQGIQLVVTAADAPMPLFDADLRQPAAFVFGNEGTGVRRAIREAADLLVKIPLYGKAESLNVATSAAICLYEAVRQRREAQGPKTP